MIGLLLSVTHISETEKRLRAAEAAAKLGQGRIVGYGERARSIERA